MGLAGLQPEAFRPDLAVSLGVRGMVLEGLGRVEEARASYTEALEIISPFADRFPDGPAGDIRAMLLDDLNELEDGEAG